MKTFVLLTACGLAMASGCQVSGEKDVDTTQRPSGSTGTSGTSGTSGQAAAPAAASAASYTMAYEATRDTEWVAGTEASAKRGTLRVGDRVMFSRTPDLSMGWQPVKMSDGSVRLVRPADFRAVTSK